MRLLTATMMLIAACGSARNSYQNEESTKYTGAQGSSLRVRVLWIKYRDTTLHVSVRVTNESGREVVLDDSSLAVTYAGKPRPLAKPLAPIKIMPGESLATTGFFGSGEKLPKEGVAVVKVTLSGHGSVTFELPVKKFETRPATAP